MIVLLDGVSYAFKCRRRMIEFSRNFNPKIGMSRHGVIINRDAAIGRNKLTVFHRQHARRVSANIIWLFSESHAAHAGAPGNPGLNLDDYLAPSSAGEFVRHRHGFIGSCGRATTWNLESVSRENGLALIFVKSCHRWAI